MTKEAIVGAIIVLLWFALEVFEIINFKELLIGLGGLIIGMVLVQLENDSKLRNSKLKRGKQ